MLARLVSMIIMPALIGAQLGSAYHLPCDASGGGHSSFHSANPAPTSHAHHHDGNSTPQDSDAPHDARGHPGCPLLMHAQGCLGTAIPTAAGAAPLIAFSADSAPWSVIASIDLLLAASLLRPPRA